MNLFFHGAADPMKQFEVQKWFELPQIFGYDLYFTNAAGFMLMGVVLCIAFLAMLRRAVKSFQTVCNPWARLATGSSPT